MMMTVQESTETAPLSVARQELRFGYNHNFRHGGRLFHVQTEDSGPGHSHIYSHVFHAGTVIASRKTEYDPSKRHSRSGIQAIMRRSHREICIMLRDGVYDELIGGLTSRPGLARRHRTNSSLPAMAPASESITPSLEDGSADLVAARKCLAAIEGGIKGFLGAALVNQENGTTLRALGSTVDMKTAVSGNAELLHMKMQLLEQLGLSGTLEDILISLDQSFCIIRPLGDALFLYVMLDRDLGNLAMARRVVSTAASEFTA